MTTKEPTLSEAWPLVDDCLTLLTRIKGMTRDQAKEFFGAMTGEDIVHEALANSELIDFIKVVLWPNLNREATDRFHAKGDGKVTERFQAHPSQKALHRETVHDLRAKTDIHKPVAEWKKEQLMVDAQQHDRERGLNRLHRQIQDEQSVWRKEMKDSQTFINRAYEALVHDCAPPTIASITIKNNLDQAKAIAAQLKTVTDEEK